MYTIYETDNFRISERLDLNYDLDSLLGDTYTPELHPELDAKTILEERREFIEAVNNEGVYGYILERWNPMPGKGWEHVDCCWGFVGQYQSYNPDRNHYIVEEYKSKIEGEDVCI